MNKTFFISLFFIFCYNLHCNAETFYRTTLFVYLNDGTIDSVVMTDGIKKGKMYINGENLDIIDADSVVHSFQRFKIIKLDMSSVTSVAEIKPSGISITPNPAKDELYFIAIEEEIMFIEVFSLTGELLFHKEICSSDKLDISMLPIGSYFIKVNGLILKFNKI